MAHENIDGMGMLIAADLYIELDTCKLIRSFESIEAEINNIGAEIWANVEPLARGVGGEAIDFAQHEFCHLMAIVYRQFHEAAVAEFGKSGNLSLWELVEKLSERALNIESGVGHGN